MKTIKSVEKCGQNITLFQRDDGGFLIQGGKDAEISFETTYGSLEEASEQFDIIIGDE